MRRIVTEQCQSTPQKVTIGRQILAVWALGVGHSLWPYGWRGGHDLAAGGDAASGYDDRGRSPRSGASAWRAAAMIVADRLVLVLGDGAWVHAAVAARGARAGCLVKPVGGAAQDARRHPCHHPLCQPIFYAHGGLKSTARLQATRAAPTEEARARRRLACAASAPAGRTGAAPRVSRASVWHGRS